MSQGNVLTAAGARLVIAHRGGAARAPENTLPALTAAAGLGADAVELDVRLSADGEVVVIHDATVDRTTDRHGSVHLMTAAELAACDAGARFTPDGHTFPFRGAGVGVPRLADVIIALGPMPLIIEVKVGAALEPTLEVLRHLGAMPRALVASAARDAVAPARGRGVSTGAATPEGAALLLWPPAVGSLPYEALCTPTRYLGLPLPMGPMIRRARRGGAVTHVWTVNDPAEAARLWRLGAVGIITDVPDTMARLRDAAGSSSP